MKFYSHRLPHTKPKVAKTFPYVFQQIKYRSVPSFTGISIPAARWIVENTNIVGVGVDTPSVDVGHSNTFDVHRILTGANLYLLENVALNNTYLPARGFQLVVMPMKLTHGTGAPARIIASPYCIGGAGLAQVSKFAIFSTLFGVLLKARFK